MGLLRISGWLGGDNQIYENLINEACFRTKCCIPCIVQSYNSANNTVEAQPAIRERVINEDGSIQYANLPLLINVPVVFPSAGKISITFPLSRGDECLVIFSDLAIDNFWLKSGVQNPVEVRRHDLSDGIAIPSKFSKVNKPTVGSGLTIKNGTTTINVGSSDITFAGAFGAFTGNEVYKLLHQ